jgi:glycosyltransferase involved in cell wall biosynthesis
VDTFVELDRMSLDLADLILVSSEHQARQLKGNPKWAPKVRVVHAGIDVNLFDVQHTGGLPPIDIIWVDNFMDLSASSLFFEGLSRLREQKPDLQVGLVGPIARPLVDPLVELIARHELSDCVKFLRRPGGRRFAAAYLPAKVGLVGPRMPSPGAFLREDCMNLLEYMACRVPVVAPRLPYIADITENGELARLYAPDNSLDLSKNLLYMLNNPDKASHMAEDAYDTVRDAYTAAGMRRALIAVYADLMAPLMAEGTAKPDDSSRPVRRRDSTISWRGHARRVRCSSPVPRRFAHRDGLPLYEMDTANINIDEIQFEASGVLLGAPAGGRAYQPNHPVIAFAFF